MTDSDVIPCMVVDFPRIIRDIRVRGIQSRNAIAKRTNIPRTSLFNYEGGDVMPSHPAGERLIDLWCELLGQSRSKVPTRLDPRTVNSSRLDMNFHKATPA